MWLNTYFIFGSRQFCRRFLFSFDKTMFGLLEQRLLLIQLVLVLRHRCFVLTATAANKHNDVSRFCN